MFAPSSDVQAALPARQAPVQMAPPPPVHTAAPAATSVYNAGPAPIQVGPSFICPKFNMPPPVSLTQGIPDLATVNEQKTQVAQAIQQRVDEQIKAINEAAQAQQTRLQQQAQRDIAQFALQRNEQRDMACLQVAEQAQTEILNLREAAIQRQCGLEEKAAMAAATYNKKKAMEDMQVKSYQAQRDWHEGEAKLMHMFEKISGKQAPAQRAVPFQMAQAAVPTQTMPAAAYTGATYAAPATTYAAPATTYSAPIQTMQGGAYGTTYGSPARAGVMV